MSMENKIKNIKEANPDIGDRSLTEVFKALKSILLGLEDKSGLYGLNVFQTVQLDTGQLDRILSNVENKNDFISLPACFIRFINVRYLVDQNRTSEGRCVARIRFVLNNIDTSNDAFELLPLEMFDIINAEIQDKKGDYPALSERCNLMYFDQPFSSNMIQAYWMDYEIYFRADSGYQYRDWVPKKIITPAFTNWSDTDQPRPDDTSINIKDQTGFTE